MAKKIAPQKGDGSELKRVLTFTIIGVNRAEKSAAVKAFCTKAKIKTFVGVQKNGEQHVFGQLNKRDILFLESAHIQILTHPAYAPTGKRRIGNLSVSISNNGGSYMDGIKVSAVVLGRDNKELKENTYKVERIILAHLRRNNIPSARMCITDSTMCVVKYTDDKTRLADLEYFDGNELKYESEEEEDFYDKNTEEEDFDDKIPDEDEDFQ